MADGRRLFLKHGSGSVADAVIDEAVRLRWLEGRVPAARLVHLVVDGTEAWMLTEAVTGLTGDAWLDRDPGALPRIIDAFAAFLRRLHALPIDDCPFEAGVAHRIVAARGLVANGRVDEEDFGEEHRGWSAAQVLAKVESLAGSTTALEQVVTHGDFSLGNLLLDGSGQVTGCIDVGRLGRADPYQDIAIFWQNLADYGADAQRRFLLAVGRDPADDDRLRLYGALDELF